MKISLSYKYLESGSFALENNEIKKPHCSCDCFEKWADMQVKCNLTIQATRFNNTELWK